MGTLSLTQSQQVTSIDHGRVWAVFPLVAFFQAWQTAICFVGIRTLFDSEICGVCIIGDRHFSAPNFKGNGRCDVLILMTTSSWHVGKDFLSMVFNNLLMINQKSLILHLHNVIFLWFFAHTSMPYLKVGQEDLDRTQTNQKQVLSYQLMILMGLLDWVMKDLGLITEDCQFAKKVLCT